MCMDSRKKRGQRWGQACCPHSPHKGVAPNAPDVDGYRHAHGEAEGKTLEADGRRRPSIEVAPGGKWWRLKYRFEGKEKRISPGVYPAVSLKEARLKALDAKAYLLDGLRAGAKA